MKAPVRILHAVNRMDRAGIETMLMNYYRHMNRERVQFDFLTHRDTEGAYDAEILSLGGRVYRAPRLFPQNYPRYFAHMRRFFREHPEYRIVHAHIDAMSYFPLRAALHAGIPVRIAHSHNTRIELGVKLPIKYAARSGLPSVANRLFACGEEAGRFLFGGAWQTDASKTVLPNAIDMTGFAFDPALRDRTRKALGLQHAFVIGHVGRFTAVKNQAFLLDVLRGVLARRPEAILMLIGGGGMEASVRRKAQRLGIADSVRFLGVRDDTAALYQAMDVFAMPSLFEGVPVAGVEAQAAGLPCYFSDRVPGEVRIGGACTFLPLTPRAWVNALSGEHCRAETLHADRYDIRIQSALLQAYYLTESENTL